MKLKGFFSKTGDLNGLIKVPEGSKVYVDNEKTNERMEDVDLSDTVFEKLRKEKREDVSLDREQGAIIIKDEIIPIPRKSSWPKINKVS